jgi:uncharacterized membrane protein YidH (DUF202 family)
MTDDRTAAPDQRSTQDRRRVFAAWAAVLALALGVLFVGVTVLTLALWFSDPGYAETNPVVDLGFFALGAVVVASGIGLQVGAPERHVAGLQQAIVGLGALGVAGLAGDRIEPLGGALVLLAAVGVLVVLHPARRSLVRPGERPSLLVGLVAAVIAVPAVLYATAMLDLALASGPSCFLGECARGDRYAEMAALAVAVAILGVLAGLGAPGWRQSAWSAAVAAALVGLASIALPQVAGSLGTAGGALAVAWAVLLAAAAERVARAGVPGGERSPRIGSPGRPV